MTRDTKFSIVIPTYNRGYCILETIQSVLGQSYQNFEIIVVDDGSTDDTEAIVSSVKDVRLKYFKKENGERAKARNYGIVRSTGDYVTFIDSDDLLKRDHFEIAFIYLQKHPSAEIFHLGYDVVSPAAEIIYRWKPLPDPANEKLIEGNFLSCLGVFVRRDIMVENQFNEDRALSGSEDYELWIRLSARYRIATLPYSTACLVNHEQRSVLQMNQKAFRLRMSLFERYLKEDRVTREVLGQKLQQLFAYHQIYASLHYAMSRKKGVAVLSLMNSLKGKPGILFNRRFWVVVKKLMVG
jgi:glycosyltransferase involved in cell wall biosynthesis